MWGPTRFVLSPRPNFSNTPVFVETTLATPQPEFGFPGVQPGQRWCLCAARWMEAHELGMAPRVALASTHQRALEIVPLELLKEFAIDLN